MPRGDGTGPNGAGAMTGRAAGYCAGFNRPGFTNQVPGRGFGMGYGRGRGRGFGYRNWAWGAPAGVPDYRSAPVYQQPLEPKAEKDALKSQAEAMKTQLESVNRRIKELDDSES